MINIQELDKSFGEKNFVDMTDDEWQLYFNKLRIEVKPSENRKMTSSPDVNSRGDIIFTYCGDTQWQYYREFINGILRTIRRGKKDYCYYIYQIKDLLKFEHDNLKAVWLPEYRCFEVYLDCNRGG